LQKDDDQRDVFLGPFGRGEELRREARSEQARRADAQYIPAMQSVAMEWLMAIRGIGVIAIRSSRTC
jgi:hypothetical protein